MVNDPASSVLSLTDRVNMPAKSVGPLGSMLDI